LDVPGEDIPCFTKLSITLFLPCGYFFFGRKKDSFGPGEGDPMKGVKAGRKGTGHARAVLCGITEEIYNTFNSFPCFLSPPFCKRRMKGSFLRGLSAFLTFHIFSVTLFTLDSRLFLIQLQINTPVECV
jgi:hypothetical protein